MTPKVKLKGPVGLDQGSHSTIQPPEPQERFEAHDEHRDFVGDNPPLQDPFELKAHEEDHTPNHTRAPKSAKPDYGKFEGRGNGGVGI